MYLLDTNIISYWMRGDRTVIDRIKTLSPSDLSISSIAIANKLTIITHNVKEINRINKLKVEDWAVE